MSVNSQANTALPNTVPFAQEFPALLGSSPRFMDRRVRAGAFFPEHAERRQFGNTYHDLSPAGRELAEAIDRYKLVRRRKFISCDELLEVLVQLGYKKTT